MTDRVHRWVLSGGIGSGKTVVRRLLEDSGFFGIDADTVGHEVLEPDRPAFDAVARHWPEVVEDGVIDRATLGRIVFADPDQLRTLEAITHPHIFGTILSCLKDWDGPVVVEVPLIEHGLGPGWGRLVVDAADEVRLARLMDRGMSREDAVSRMKVQPGRNSWLAVADAVIPNHGPEYLLEEAARRIPLTI